LQNFFVTIIDIYFLRPTLVRTDWMNLNGPWDISITVNILII